MALPIAQQKTRATSGGEILYGLLSGLVPLLFAGSFVMMTIILTALVRQTFSADGFFAWQRDALITLLAGLLLTALTYAISLTIVLRHVRVWQRAGLIARCTATVLALLVTACIVILPLILAVALPQHPAP